MGKYVTVSVKITKQTKEMLDRLGIKPSSLLKDAIQHAIRLAQARQALQEAEHLKQTLMSIPVEDVVRAIREDREME